MGKRVVFVIGDTSILFVEQEEFREFIVGGCRVSRVTRGGSGGDGSLGDTSSDMCGIIRAGGGFILPWQVMG